MLVGSNLFGRKITFLRHHNRQDF